MTLDPPKSDAEYRRLAAERERRTVNGVRLGAASPLLETPAPRIRKRPFSSDEPSEHDIQVELFEKINDPAEQRRRPALALVHAVPNGGYRSPRTAGRLKAEGVKPGVPDIDCPVARGGYIGLRIEMKRPGQATTPAQADWLYQLAKEGHKTALHTTSEGAWAELLAYLDEPRTVIG